MIVSLPTDTHLPLVGVEEEKRGGRWVRIKPRRWRRENGRFIAEYPDGLAEIVLGMMEASKEVRDATVSGNGEAHD